MTSATTIIYSDFSGRNYLDLPPAYTPPPTYNPPPAYTPSPAYRPPPPSYQPKKCIKVLRTATFLPKKAANLTSGSLKVFANASYQTAKLAAKALLIVATTVASTPAKIVKFTALAIQKTLLSAAVAATAIAFVATTFAAFTIKALVVTVVSAVATPFLAIVFTAFVSFKITKTVAKVALATLGITFHLLNTAASITGAFRGSREFDAFRY